MVEVSKVIAYNVRDALGRSAHSERSLSIAIGKAPNFVTTMLRRLEQESGFCGFDAILLIANELRTDPTSLATPPARRKVKEHFREPFEPTGVDPISGDPSLDEILSRWRRVGGELGADTELEAYSVVCDPPAGLEIKPTGVGVKSMSAVHFGMHSAADVESAIKEGPIEITKRIGRYQFACLTDGPHLSTALIETTVRDRQIGCEYDRLILPMKKGGSIIATLTYSKVVRIS